MKVVILAGGYGTRISEESYLRPKPMIEIGGKPILWHIMKHYSHYGHNDFIICAGYKQHMIKEWFADYFLHNSDVTFNFKNGKDEIRILNQHCDPWEVTVVDTGLNTQTSGRIRRIQKYVGDETFMLTYGDGVSDVNLDDLCAFHEKMHKAATITSVMIEQNKGVLDVQGGLVQSFREKNNIDNARINGGFMVLDTKVFDYLGDDTTPFERAPMDSLAADGELAAYRHDGFWQCMDTKREMERLEQLWETGNAPWKTWRTEL
ncbi:MAG: glucose-1-phosphate cytidylyltransferase [Lachnospiraceae bacterium]|nr:glucose-1-phosphate cytidylyltransferase [Lachnospiraceae bacterium]